MALAALTSTPAGPAFSQAIAGDNTVQEIVVTAQKRSENLQDVPPGLQIKTDDNATSPRTDGLYAGVRY